MPDQHKSDIVMRFVLKSGDDVDAECALEKSKSDTEYMDGFVPQTYDSYSNFFQLSKFNFGFEVSDEGKSKTKVGSTQSNSTQTERAKISGGVQGEFASWRSADEEQAKKVVFQLDFESFRFERLIDAASPIFFLHCCNSLSFKSATLVKRVSRGGDSAPEGFLRIDFQDVLITSLGWDDGDMTTEKCEFICRDFKLKYRQQNAGGSWGASSSASWNFEKDALPTDKQSGR
jgi:type VI protein secretion system component Hcp